jgi:hypothetical protein
MAGKSSKKAKAKAARSTSPKTPKAVKANIAPGSEKAPYKFSYCSQPKAAERTFDAGLTDNRVALIRNQDKKWVNGTQLHYFFFKTARWRGTEDERAIVRKAFKAWKDVGIGLEFSEVDTPDEAEVRVGFQRGDGAWSYVGRDVLNQAESDRTMNFGWNIRHDIDTAIHEIGHTLGFPHEHQNPNAGIVWDEEAVYAELAGPPNNWSREKTHWNIIRKLPQSDVEGSVWDSDSIMHYPFDRGMILKPEEFRTKPLEPAPGLSARDKEWAKHFYPELSANDYQELKPFKSVQAAINPGQQLNFYLKPTATRKYELATFGMADTVMVLFEEVDGSPRYLSGDDDSGEALNSRIEYKLIAGRTYILRIRLYWQHKKGDFGVMMW